MTLDQTMKEKWGNHDCHLSEEDGCSVCEEYCQYLEMKSRNRKVKLTVKWSGDNYPYPVSTEKYNSNIIGGSVKTFIK